MDLSEILHVCFHLGGEFIRIGPNLQYVGGDEAMSDIERDKLSLQEVKGFLKDHIALKESMKFYFLIPGQDLMSGLIFLNDDSKCMKMAYYVDVGAFADIYVEYHREEDSADSSSGSDFEDEIVCLSEYEPDVVITAAEPAESDTDVLITDQTGVVREVMSNPQKHRRSSARPQKHTVAAEHENVTELPNVSQAPLSQVLDPTQNTVAAAGHDVASAEHDVAAGHDVAAMQDSASDSDSDFVYIPHSDDSGEDSEVVGLRRHARKFKKRMKDSKSWIGTDAEGSVPIELIANMEQQIAAEQDDWKYDSSDEDYSYDEDSDGELVKRKSKFIRYNIDDYIL
ncbi:unnamed protein product [Alopecurus aequalis]